MQKVEIGPNEIKVNSCSKKAVSLHIFQVISFL